MRSTISISLVCLLLGQPALAQSDATLADRAAALTELRAWMGVTITGAEVDGAEIALTATADLAPDVSGLDAATRDETVAFTMAFACNVVALRDLSLDADLSVALSDPFGNAIGTYPIACAAPTTTAEDEAARDRAREAARAFLDALPEAPFTATDEPLGLATSPDGQAILTIYIPDMLPPAHSEGRAEIAAAFMAEACALPAANALFSEGGSLMLDLSGPQGSIAQIQATFCTDYEIFE